MGAHEAQNGADWEAVEEVSKEDSRTWKRKPRGRRVQNR